MKNHVKSFNIFKNLFENVKPFINMQVILNQFTQNKEKTMKIDDDSRSAEFSRRLLIDTILLLKPFMDSLTVVGAHAVFARVAPVLSLVEMPSTRDADLAVNPQFVAPTPVIREIMKQGGLEFAMKDRPGIYGRSTDSGVPFRDRTTIDLLVPEIYAGKGRRSARIIGQEKAATFALGLEYSLFNRSLMEIASLPEDPDPVSVEVMVAKPAALLIAKAHKVKDRLQQFTERPRRLRAKDSGDIGLLMLASDPLEVAQDIEQVFTDHPETQEIGEVAVRFLTSDNFTEPESILCEQMDDQIFKVLRQDKREEINDWINRFRIATKHWFDEQ